MSFTKLLGFFAILAALCLGALVYLQYDEYTFYQQAPSAWPAQAGQ